MPKETSRKTTRVPRLKDVAEEAGVSIGTASRVLNGDARSFQQHTQDRVFEAARQLGWRRNLLVDGIQKGRTKTVGVMIPPHDSFWIGVIAGIHIELVKHDYLPITVWVGDCRQLPNFDGDELGGVDQVSRLLDRRVDGLILWPSFAAAFFDHYRELMERRIPVVAIDHCFQEDGIGDVVETDERAGARLAAEHLLSLGHRQLANFSAREVEWQSWAVRRREHFSQAVAELAGGTATVRDWKLSESGDDGLEVAKQILTAKPRPTAVFAVSDHVARYVYQAASELGLSIPGDVSVLGYADLDFSEYLTPRLSTLRQPALEIGHQAASAVINRLKDADATPPDTRVIQVRPTLIARESTSMAEDG